MTDSLDTVTRTIQKYHQEKLSFEDDYICCEEPLEYRVPFVTTEGEVKFRTLAITMRTPGNDIELATGFLFSEGLIQSATDITGYRYCDELGDAGHKNSLEIQLLNPIPVENHLVERRFTTYSSCGLCGKTSIQSLEMQNPPVLEDKNNIVELSVLNHLSSNMESSQVLFQQTGSAHASGLFDFNGILLHIFEDVGRHNALDKLIGFYLNNNPEQLSQSILMVSGRASFELVQKAIMAGIQIIVAVGAPSSLAVDTAKRFNLTLVGFIRNNSFNIYNAPFRLKTTTSI